MINWIRAEEELPLYHRPIMAWNNRSLSWLLSARVALSDPSFVGDVWYVTDETYIRLRDNIITHWYYLEVPKDILI